MNYEHNEHIFQSQFPRGCKVEYDGGHYGGNRRIDGEEGNREKEISERSREV